MSKNNVLGGIVSMQQQIQPIHEESWQNQAINFAQDNPWAAVVIAVFVLIIFKDKIRNLFK